MDYYSKSGRQPFFKLLLSGLLFMVFGNLLCTIVTVSTAPFMNFEFFKVIVFILTLIIFYSLMFTAGYRDGDREQKYVRLHKAEPPKENKWVLIGIILMAIMFVPSLLLLLDKLCGWYFDMTFVHRIIDGLVYPLSLMIVPENTIDSMDIFVPFIYMLCYAGIPVATHLGYYFGYTQKFNKDDIMYQ